MDMTREVSTNVTTPDSEKLRAPINQFVHATKFPDANYKDIVRPNVDTLYSMAWLDLEQEPMVLDLPDTNKRYYLMPMLDGWTNVFDSPGSRTTGTLKNKVVIVGPNWKGEEPTNMKIIRSPTNMAWVVGRIETKNAQDGKKTVAKIQKSIKLYPLSYNGKSDYVSPKSVVNSSIKMDPPIDKVFALSTEDFFNRLNRLMVSNPPPEADQEVLAKFSKYNIGPGAEFVPNPQNPRELKKLTDLPVNMRERFNKELASLAKPVNGWVILRNLGSYETDYHKRAIVAHQGLGANLDADAIYPNASIDGNGEKLTGTKNYILHFSKEEVPTVKGFWSLTVYGKDGFLVSNPLNRFALGSNSKLKYNADGSLDVYLQNDSPGKQLETNWLPTPTEDFDVTARMYWPQANILDNASWSLPAIMLSTNLQQAQEE
jgi:DNA sulfur modification protein DndE